MARDVTPLFAWTRAVLLAHSDVTDVVEQRIFQRFPKTGQPYPGLALHDGGTDYDGYAQGGTTFHGVVIPIEAAGTNPNQLRALEAAIVSAFEPAHYSTIDAPDGFQVNAVELEDASQVREDLDHEPTLFRRILPVAITALPV